MFTILLILIVTWLYWLKIWKFFNFIFT